MIGPTTHNLVPIVWRLVPEVGRLVPIVGPFGPGGEAVWSRGEVVGTTDALDALGIKHRQLRKGS
jgi:hypothetical protein